MGFDRESIWDRWNLGWWVLHIFAAGLLVWAAMCLFRRYKLGNKTETEEV